VLLSALLVSSAWPAGAAPASSVHIFQGRIQGTAIDGAIIFRGIPFAQPPLGSWRWRAPRPPLSWSGQRSASSAAAACMQQDFGWNAPDAAHDSEDCLYLDVRTPSLHPRRALPVMVWVHGGGNRAGSARGVVDSGITRRGVVLVALQYRLGVFGFLSHPALTRESAAGAAGNFALLDQIAALRWVQANIAAFGGDPGNVTLFGHSSGAEDIGLLLVSPLARGLFTRAIEESGTPGFGLPPRTLAANEAIGRQLAAAEAVGDDARGLRALRARDAASLLAAAAALQAPGLPDQSYLWLQSVIDGRVIPRQPQALLRAGLANPAALIVGSNVRELTVPDGRLDAFLRQAFGVRAERARLLYHFARADAIPPPDALLGSLSEQLSADVLFKCPAVHLAALRAAAGQSVWQYQVSDIDPEREFGHAAELPSVLDDQPLGSAGAAPGVSLQAYWVQFARSGDPNADALPRWPRFEAQQHNYLDFTAQGPRLRRDLRAAPCALLERI
jgi:para-nitrobenzyl esterase